METLRQYWRYINSSWVGRVAIAPEEFHGAFREEGCVGVLFHAEQFEVWWIEIHVAGYGDAEDLAAEWDVGFEGMVGKCSGLEFQSVTREEGGEQGRKGKKGGGGVGWKGTGLNRFAPALLPANMRRFLSMFSLSALFIICSIESTFLHIALRL